MMLQNTIGGKQVMGPDKAYMEARPNSDTAIIRTGDEATVEEETTLEGEEEILADDTQGDRSTITTEWSHDKKVFSPQASPILEAETDPTSIPSGFLEDLDLERKCTESPLDSIEAIQGSDSVHSSQSDPSTGDNNSREGGPIAVNAGKVEAIGDHFGVSSTETSPPRFHDPKNSWEAQQINRRIMQAFDKMDDINRHPEARFQDHGSPFQVSARPKPFAESALDVENDIAYKPKVHSQPGAQPGLDMEEGCNIDMPRRRRSLCCTIM